jgi:anti-sigma B factor antagonist
MQGRHFPDSGTQAMTTVSHGQSISPVVLAGELTIYRASEVCGLLKSAIADGGDLHLDLSDVCEFDSAGMQLLLSAQKTLARDGRTLVITACSEAVSEVVALMGIRSLREAAEPAGIESGSHLYLEEAP